MQLQRWITGLLALPFLIFLVYKGNAFFTVLVSVACLFSLWEYFRIVFNGDRQTVFGLIAVWGYFVSLAILWITYTGDHHFILSLLALNLLIVAFISLFQFKSAPSVITVIYKQTQGIVYIPLFLSFLILIRNSPDGMIWIFTFLAIIFAGDITAYYIGSYFGRHKLCPSISPGKTVEGAIGGVIANLVAGAVAKYFFLPHLPWGLSILFFMAIGVAGQVGDLFESEFKRSSNVKDSGGVLPGHGGFLDRIDALLFAAPVAYLFKAHIL